MKRILLIVVLSMFCTQANADVLYHQPPNASGGFYHSSWWDPDGSNYDEYVWDRFVLAVDADVDSVAWRGTYDPQYGGDTPIINFTVAIYGSSVNGSEPDVSHPPLVEFETGGNAGQTYAGVFGGATMYDYRFALPASFHAQAEVPYWVQIEGWQNGFPGWSLARGTGGSGYHFRCQHLTLARDGVPTGCWFTAPSGDTAFTLLTAAVTGVDDTRSPFGFSLIGVLPNPSRSDRVEMSFRLPNSAPAQLSLFDVLGRRVSFREVGLLGAGPHVVDLADPFPIEPGIYFARLAQGSTSDYVKVMVLR